MALIEFQISVSSFLAGQLSNLQSQDVCIPQVTIDGHQIVVDHIEFGANTLQRGAQTEKLVLFEQPLYGTESQTVTTQQIQIVQPVAVVVADVADVKAHPNGAPTLFSLPASLVVNVDYVLFAGPQFFLTIAVDHVEVGQLPPLPPGVNAQQLVQQFTSAVRGLVSASRIPFDFVTPLGGSEVENVGLSADPDLTRLALRVELGSTTLSPAIWQAFYNGNVADRLQGSDFALFLPGGFLELLVSDQISLGVGTGKGRFHLVTGFGSTYSNPVGKAHVTTVFGGNVDAKVCTLWVDVTVNSDITMGAINSLTIDATATPQVQTSLCSVALEILGVLISDTILSLDLLDLLFGALTNVFSVLASDLASATQQGSSSPLTIASCQSLSQFHYVCTRSLKIPQSLKQGKLSLNHLLALDDGVSLAGTLQPAPLSTASLQPAINNFGWVGPAISCGEVTGKEVDEFRRNPKAFVFLHADVTLNNGGTAPLYLCGFTVVNDPLGVFPQNRVQSSNGQTPIVISIDVPYPGDQYFQKPYPCQILVQTTGGARLVSIPPPAPLTEQDINAMANALADQIGGCAELVDGWFRLFHRFNPVWSIDPPPDSEVDHFYEIDVNGLQPGEQASLVDAVGQTIVTATAQAGQALRVSALVAPSAAGEVGLVRGAGQAGAAAEIVAGPAAPSANPPAGSQARGIGVTERLMIRTSTILLGSDCQRLGAVYFAGLPCALIVVEDGALAYDLSTPSLPRVASGWTVPGLQGVVSSDRGLLGFGDDGFALLEQQGTRRLELACCQTNPVCDAVAGQSAIYAVGPEGLQIFSPRLQRLNSIVVEGAVRLAQLGTTLFVAGTAGLVVFDTTTALHPVRMGVHQLAGITDVELATDGDGRRLLAVLSTGPAQLLDFSDATKPVLVATYSQPPWFLGTARLPGLLLKVSADARAIRVSAFGRSKTL
jgi:hypothetical protein